MNNNVYKKVRFVFKQCNKYKVFITFYINLYNKKITFQNKYKNENYNDFQAPRRNTCK